MKAVGVVVEYNPFHNGHHYHVQKSKQITESDIVIAVMSGSFLQRGEPALINKWARTRMALQNGVDLVIELPYIYSTQHAKIFAEGAVSLLEALRCDYFCFGSENGTIQQFRQAYRIMQEKKEALDDAIRSFSKQGFNYPTAVSKAWGQIAPSEENSIDLSKPNNILGYQYIAAALNNHYRITPALINRIGAQYHDEKLPEGQIASATSIRKSIMDSNGDNSQTKAFMPEASFEELTSHIHTFHELHHWELYWPLLQYMLLVSSPEHLRTIYEVEEGIEYRLKEAAQTSGSFASFISFVKTKRYTLTRLQRICVHILTQTKKDEMNRLMHSPAYLRILGFNQKGRMYMNEKKKQFELPLISKIGSAAYEALALDVKAAKVHSLPLPPAGQQQLFKREYQQPVIM
ncbi:nucleotidyltransferase [Bacillus testis]|uniref:nucleotidyltransferase n=1 Tax=Bacillus testis TaxID=1622072 RepID=UPI00067ED711|nr:nucleotidyltransferase [Bacillus testis]